MTSTWTFIGYIFLTFAALATVLIYGLIAMTIIADIQEWRHGDDAS